MSEDLSLLGDRVNLGQAMAYEGEAGYFHYCRLVYWPPHGWGITNIELATWISIEFHPTPEAAATEFWIHDVHLTEQQKSVLAEAQRIADETMVPWSTSVREGLWTVGQPDAQWIGQIDYRCPFDLTAGESRTQPSSGQDPCGAPSTAGGSTSSKDGYPRQPCSG